MASRGVFRGVYSVLFDDPDFQQLPVLARWTLVTLRLSRDTGPAAIFEYSTDRLRRQTGLSRRELDAALATLQQTGWIDRDASLLWVRNGLRYDPLMRIDTNPHHKAAVVRWLTGLPKRSIVMKFCDYYHLAYPFESLPGTTPDGTPPGTPPTMGGASLRNKEKEKEVGEGVSAVALDAPASSRPAPQFQIPDSIRAALAKCPTLAQTPKLLDPAWWQAEVRANNERGVNYAAEVLKAQAWIASNPTKAPRKNLPRFLHNWFARSHGDDA